VHMMFGRRHAKADMTVVFEREFNCRSRVMSRIEM
jgi:hypothetical protein